MLIRVRALSMNLRLFLGCCALIAACSSGGSTSGSMTPDAASAGDAQNDGTAQDAGAGCPAQQPGFSVTCSGSITCSYGQSTCCGITTSEFTCQCQHGSFSCSQTVECNFVCPEAGD
jgi:hypothetical protein